MLLAKAREGILPSQLLRQAIQDEHRAVRGSKFCNIDVLCQWGITDPNFMLFRVHVMGGVRGDDNVVLIAHNILYATLSFCLRNMSHDASLDLHALIAPTRAVEQIKAGAIVISHGAKTHPSICAERGLRHEFCNHARGQFFKVLRGRQPKLKDIKSPYWRHCVETCQRTIAWQKLAVFKYLSKESSMDFFGNVCESGNGEMPIAPKKTCST